MAEVTPEVHTPSLAHLAPDGWWELVYPITPSYRLTWGMWEAIRELVQNALDETDTYEVKQTATETIIRDRGGGFTPHNLLLGAAGAYGTKTGKAKWARGRFGEGMKFALQTLLREGYSVKIRTRNYEMEPKFTKAILPPAKEPEEVFMIRYREVPEYFQGTEIRIIGYTGTTYPERFNVGQKRVVYKIEREVEGHKLYDMLIDEEPKVLYVRNIYVPSPSLEKALYSYDLSFWLWDMHKVLSEDRNIANDFVVEANAGQIWASMTDPNMIEKFLNAVRMGLWEANVRLYQVWSDELNRWVGGIPEPNRPLWKEAFHRVYGERAVIRTGLEGEKLAKYVGFEPVVLPMGIEGPIKACGVLEDAEAYRRHVEEIVKKRERPPLIPAQERNLKALKLIVEALVPYYPRLRGYTVETIKLPPGITGYRDESARIIYIVDEALYRLPVAISTLLHELGHAIFDAPDNSAAMANAEAELGSIIFFLPFDTEFRKKLREAVRRAAVATSPISSSSSSSSHSSSEIEFAVASAPAYTQPPATPPPTASPPPTPPPTTSPTPSRKLSWVEFLKKAGFTEEEYYALDRFTQKALREAYEAQSE